jgi:hypothetical protein
MYVYPPTDPLGIDFTRGIGPRAGTLSESRSRRSPASAEVLDCPQLSLVGRITGHGLQGLGLLLDTDRASWNERQTGVAHADKGVFQCGGERNGPIHWDGQGNQPLALDYLKCGISMKQQNNVLRNEVLYRSPRRRDDCRATHSRPPPSKSSSPC